MANIWIDASHNGKENGEAGVAATFAKQTLDVRSFSVKKKAFGDLKNVIHNGGLTPLQYRGPQAKVTNGSSSVVKSAAKKDHNDLKQAQGQGLQQTKVIDGVACDMPTTKSLYNDVLRKQQLKKNFVAAQQAIEKKLQPQPKTTIKTPKAAVPFDEELFDLWDPLQPCCLGEAKKTDEIWSEMNMIDDAKIDKLIDDLNIIEQSSFDDAENVPNFNDDLDELDAQDIWMPSPGINWNAWKDSGDDDVVVKLPDFDDSFAAEPPSFEFDNFDGGINDFELI